MTAASDAVLLDTCAVIWLANGDPILPQAMLTIRSAAVTRAIYVSPITAWEIGLLSRPRPNRAADLHFQPDPKTWFARFMGGPGIQAAALTPDIAIEASHLPGDLHSDPADRLIIATARHLGMPVVTRDRKIIAYGESGFVCTVPC